jgi:hypothetical protein
MGVGMGVVMIFDGGVVHMYMRSTLCFLFAAHIFCHIGRSRFWVLGWSTWVNVSAEPPGSTGFMGYLSNGGWVCLFRNMAALSRS